jgi:hypothetical protein
MRIKKVIKNPVDDYDEECELLIANPKPPIPFVRQIRAEPTERIYTFSPTAKTEFDVVVKYPVSDYEVKIEVSGKNINPNELINALDFVKKNEFSFIEAFDDSRERPPFEQLELSEAEFQKLLPNS